MPTPDVFMREALRAAEEGLEIGEMPIAAVVVLGERVIASRHRESTGGRRLAHAELLAMDDADRLSPFPGTRADALLFTTLEPCPLCAGAAMAFGIRQIHYALEAPLDGAARSVGARTGATDVPEYRSFPTVAGGLLRNESLELFRRYIATPNANRWAHALVESVQA